MSGKDKLSENELSLEEAFEQIENKLAQMEKEDISLEESFQNYEQGMKLIQICAGKIDQVEKKLMVLNDNGEACEV